jgi:hypothetical protein
VTYDLAASERDAANLRDVTAAIYRGLGEAALAATNDVMCIRLHVAARRFGAYAEQWRAFSPHRAAATPVAVAPMPALDAAIAEWQTADPTGQLLLIAVVAEVVPRLLVSLRDLAVRTEPDVAAMVQVASRQAALLVVDQQTLGVALRDEAPVAEELAGPLAAGAARLDSAGFGESFRLATL